MLRQISIHNSTKPYNIKKLYGLNLNIAYTELLNYHQFHSINYNIYCTVGNFRAFHYGYRI